MTLKSIVLAGVTALSLAAPAVALADPWDHDRGYHEGWRDRDEGRRHEWREHEAWEHRGYGWGYGPRCFIERRGYHNWYGEYVWRPVRVCR
ncbi:MAG TPA: hypothetical protein VNW53_03335 [Phenylobacterium sp.]|jgi:hypothetical protein|uniref:hypothetical protein n=1 Tax=Phenylobacterium sp. TaxID=1871053 RepID=UPI002B82F8AF|nr:hypothetical protein [Phenylobacterium sp.]HXA38007.1 hypothetical protein [Phenylobacterium sp.]